MGRVQWFAQWFARVRLISDPSNRGHVSGWTGAHRPRTPCAASFAGERERERPDGSGANRAVHKQNVLRNYPAARWICSGPRSVWSLSLSLTCEARCAGGSGAVRARPPVNFACFSVVFACRMLEQITLGRVTSSRPSGDSRRAGRACARCLALTGAWAVVCTRRPYAHRTAAARAGSRTGLAVRQRSLRGRGDESPCARVRPGVTTLARTARGIPHATKGLRTGEGAGLQPRQLPRPWPRAPVLSSSRQRRAILSELSAAVAASAHRAGHWPQTMAAEIAHKPLTFGGQVAAMVVAGLIAAVLLEHLLPTRRRR